MYSLKNRAFAGVLALLMLLSMTGCAGTTSGEESSGSTITQEEYDALKEQNEKLQAELDELKGETDGEAEDGTESDTSGEGEDTSGSSASGSAPADNASSSAPAQTSSAAPVQTSTANGKGPLAKYTVNVYDSATPAVKVTGKLYNGIAAYVFTSADGTVVGTIPDSELGTIIWENGLSYAEADEQKAWFVENFNIYRGLDSGSSSGSSSSSSSSSTSSEVDIEDLRQEVFDLVNEERVANGLPKCAMDDTAMEFAQIRAEEIVDKFSHTRPDGTVMTYSHYNFAENIAMGQDTPKDVVNAWMNSSGHRAVILGDYSDYGNCMGVGVYKANGKLHWVLEFIGWDANA